MSIFKLLPPWVPYAAAFGLGCLVTATGMEWRHQAVLGKIEKARADTLSDQRKADAEQARDAAVITAEGDRKDAEIRKVRPLAAVDIHLSDCPWGEPERVRFNERRCQRRAAAGLPCTMPDLLRGQ